MAKKSDGVAKTEPIEKDNPSLKDVLPKVFACSNLDPASLGGLIDLVGNIALGDAKARSADVLGHVFEYFLGEFALAEGKNGGPFYTPRSVVGLPDEEADFDFKERFAALKAEFEEQLVEEARLNVLIAESLTKVKI